MELEEVELEDGKVTLVGHKHSFPSEIPLLGRLSFIDDLIYSNDFDQFFETLEAEMEDADGFTWEYLGYDEELEEEITQIWPNTGSEYIDRTLEMASENFDEMWGPDSKTSRVYSYLPAAGMAPIAAGTAYKLKSPDSKRESDSGANLSVNRREFLTALPLVGSLWATGITDTVQPERVEESLDKAEQPFSVNYNDMREVFISEGLSQMTNEIKGDVVAPFGDIHTSSIKNYLEDEDARDAKIEKYEEVLPDDDQMMTRWEDTGYSWRLEEIRNIYSSK